MILWRCPNDAHPAKRGPARPAKDATVRYCLPCSEDTGRLVLRVARSLDKARAVKAVQDAARAAARKARAAERRSVERAERKHREVTRRRPCGIDLDAELQRLCRCPSLRMVNPARVNLTILRTSAGSRGRAYCGAWWPQKGRRHVVPPGTGLGGTIRLYCREADGAPYLYELLLHEVCHVGTPTVNHGPAFRELRSAVARERWGVEVAPYAKQGRYEVDDLITQAIGKRLATASEPPEVTP